MTKCFRPACAAALFISTTACGGDGNRYRAVAAGPIKPPPAIPSLVATAAPAEAPIDARGERTEHLSAAQVTAVAAALNRGEIELAGLARSRSASDEVRSFARVMERDHALALREVGSVADSVGAAAAQPTALLEHTARSAEQQATELRPLFGPAFDVAYMDGQIALHQAALDDIDQRLLRDAGSARLQALLRRMRGMVSEHLQVAVQVRRKLAG